MASANQAQPLAPPSDTRGPMVLQAEFIMAGIATPILIARLFARLKRKTQLRLDDYLMVLSWAFSLVSTGILPSTVKAGLGTHVYHVDPDQVSWLVKLAYVATPFGFLALVFGRASFAVSLLQVVGTIRWRRWLLYFIIATQFVSTFFVLFVVLFICKPIRKFWDQNIPGTCLNYNWRTIPGYVQGGFTIFADLVLAIMPSLVIAKLKLKKRTKAVLIFLMGLGVCNMAAAIVGVILVSRAFWDEDPTYNRALIVLCGGVQTYLVITIASIPFLRPLFVGQKAFSWAFYRSFLGRYSRHGSASSGHQREKSGESTETLCEKGEKPLPSLPHVHKERFATTTVRNVGNQTETGVNTLRNVEEGSCPKR